jgi:hypothetical protein
VREPLRLLFGNGARDGDVAMLHVYLVADPNKGGKDGLREG